MYGVHTLHSTTDSVIRLLPFFFDISLRRMDLKQQHAVAVHSVRIISKELAKQSRLYPHSFFFLSFASCQDKFTSNLHEAIKVLTFQLTSRCITADLTLVLCTHPLIYSKIAFLEASRFHRLSGLKEVCQKQAVMKLHWMLGTVPFKEEASCVLLHV